MLQLNGVEWSTGRASLSIGAEVNHLSMSTAMWCCFNGLPPVLAFVDTGCTLSIAGGEWAALLCDQLGMSIGTSTLSTRLGSFDGNIYRCPIRLVTEQGKHANFDANLLLAPEWPGPPVLGYTNALDRVRIAFDPGVVPGCAYVYFGVAR